MGFRLDIGFKFTEFIKLSVKSNITFFFTLSKKMVSFPKDFSKTNRMYLKIYENSSEKSKYASEPVRVTMRPVRLFSVRK